MELEEELELFTNVLRARFYNSGYREGLFMGKSEIIQEGFDSAYEISAKLAILEILKESFCGDLNELKTEEEEGIEIDKEEIVKKIEEIKIKVLSKVPEIKIAKNIFIEDL